MARIAELTVGFDADTRGLDSGVKNVNKTVKETGKQVSSSFGKSSTQAIGGTTSAVINFNRVIQDAPFGIIGVANNLDPLAQSFQNLRAQTGSARGALMTLLRSAFTGPGALITAVSLAGSALILLQRRFRKTGKDAEEAKAGIESFTSALDNQIDAISDLRAEGDKGLDVDIRKSQDRIKILDEAISELDLSGQEIGRQGIISDETLRKVNGLFGTSITFSKEQKNQLKIQKQLTEERAKEQEKLNGLLLFQNTETATALQNQKEALQLAKSPIKPVIEFDTSRFDRDVSKSLLEDLPEIMAIGLEEAMESLDEFASKTVDFGEQLKVPMTQAQVVSESLSQSIQMLGESFAIAFSQGIIFGQKFSDVLSNLLKQLASQQLVKFLTAFLVGGLTGGGGMISGFLGTGGGLFGRLFGTSLYGQGFNNFGQSMMTPVMGKQNLNVTGEFRVRGSDLVTAISNTNNRTLR